MNELVVSAKDEELEKINGILEEFLEENEFSMKAIMQIQLVIEEVFVNVCHYAYEEKTEFSEDQKLAWVEYGIENDRFIFILKDKGKPFDPLSKEDPDVTLSAEERNIGGLGIFLTKKIMDKVEYSYEKEFNILRLEKVK